LVSRLTLELLPLVDPYRHGLGDAHQLMLAAQELLDLSLDPDIS
jgi:hypothetical protein